MFKSTKNIIDGIFNTNTDTETIKNVPFYELLSTCEREIGSDIYQWDPELIDYLHLKRINQLWMVAKTTDYYKKYFDDFDRFSTLSDFYKNIVSIDRDDYRKYMADNTLGLINSGINEKDLVESKSGGTGGVPVVTYFTAQDADSVAITEVKNYFRLFKDEHLHRFWDLSSDKKSATHKKYWDLLNSDLLRCYKGKIQDKNELIEFLKTFRPDAFRATAYSVIKQVQKFESLVLEFPDIEPYIDAIKVFIYGGEFITSETISYIKKVLINGNAISRYGTSQALGAIGYSRTEHPELHVLNQNLCHVHLIDGNGLPITKVGIEGEVVITQLHNSHIPILNVRMNDYASYVIGNTGQQLLRLHGRTDGILIINTQKIAVKPLLEQGMSVLKSFNINVNGICQLVKTNYSGIQFKYELVNGKEQTHLNQSQLQAFSNNIVEVIKKLAAQSGLPVERSVENLRINCVLMPDESIPRHGDRSKVKIYVDETF